MDLASMLGNTAPLSFALFHASPPSPFRSSPPLILRRPSSPSTLSVPYLHSFTLSFQCHTFRQQGWDVSATCPTFITPLDVWTTHHLGDGFLHAYTVWSKKLNFLYVLNNSVKITDYYSARRKSRLILTEL